MTNKLRVYTGLFGGVLTLVALWGTFQYDGPAARFLVAALLGIVVVTTPYAAAYAKLVRERRRQAGLNKSIYASPPLEMDRETFIDTSESALGAADEYVEVKRREFPEGTGLVVDHTRFHGTFVRFTASGRAVVTGIKNDATRSVVETLESVVSSTLTRQASNPFLRPIPVRGLPRATLTLALTALIVLDAAFVAGLAYPSPAYNPGEKAILVGFDVRAVVDPGVDETDAQLSKAGFLVAVLREEATEIRWQSGIDDSSRASVNDAAAISADITRLLDVVSAHDLSPDERARVERLRAAQFDALAEVQAALAEPAPTPATPDSDNPFDVVESSNTTTTATAVWWRGDTGEHVPGPPSADTVAPL